MTIAELVQPHKETNTQAGHSGLESQSPVRCLPAKVRGALLGAANRCHSVCVFAAVAEPSARKRAPWGLTPACAPCPPPAHAYMGPSSRDRHLGRTLSFGCSQQSQAASVSRISPSEGRSFPPQRLQCVGGLDRKHFPASQGLPPWEARSTVPNSKAPLSSFQGDCPQTRHPCP